MSTPCHEHGVRADLRRARRARESTERLCRLPPRVLAELLVLIDRTVPERGFIDTAEAFSRVRPEALGEAAAGPSVQVPT